MLKLLGKSTWGWVGWIGVLFGLSSATDLIVKMGEINLTRILDQLLSFYRGMLAPIHSLFESNIWPYSYDPLWVNFGILYAVLVGISYRDEKTVSMIDKVGDPLTVDEWNEVEVKNTLDAPWWLRSWYFPRSDRWFAKASFAVMRVLVRGIAFACLVFIFFTAVRGALISSDLQAANWHIFMSLGTIMEVIAASLNGNLGTTLSPTTATQIAIVFAGLIMGVSYNVEFGPPASGRVSLTEVLTISSVFNLRPIAAYYSVKKLLTPQLNKLKSDLENQLEVIESQEIQEILSEIDQILILYRRSFYQFVSIPLGLIVFFLANSLGTL